jgi:hypothetical protein
MAGLPPICASGGALGADLAWGAAAEKAGHTVIHFLFEEHKNNAIEHSVILSQEELNKADQYLIAVNKKVLKRTFPTASLHTNNLLRRNYFQVDHSNAVYAVAGIDISKDAKTLFGGTAWAAELFKFLHPNSEDIYVFDQSFDKWFQWKFDLGFADWFEIDKPPKPEGIYAGIGTRKLLENGKLAIESVYH